MGTMYTETLDALIANMKAENFVRAKFVRRAIDNSKEVRNVLKLDGDAKTRFQEFKAKVAATNKDESNIEFKGDSYKRDTAEKIINTVEGKGAAEDRLTYRQLSEKGNAVMGKLFKDMENMSEMGHKEFSVMVAQMALLLKEMDAKDPRRPQLRALFVVVQQLDDVTDDIEYTGKGKADLDRLIHLSTDLLTSEYDITADAQVVVDAFKGVDGEVSFEFENRFLNQLKGRMAARLGTIFKDVVQGNTTKFEKNFAGIDISKLSGSPSIQDRIAEQVTHILDPAIKSRPKKATVTPKPGRGTVKKKRGTRKKAKSSGLTAPVLLARAKKKNVKTSKVSISQLLPILNAALPARVASNMHKPYLESRTGRFARSVRAIDTTKTAKGHVSVGYTYQRDPYGVYETTSGTRFADGDRDPRKIIDQSIRELAAQFGLGRLYTRRV